MRPNPFGSKSNWQSNWDNELGPTIEIDSIQLGPKLGIGIKENLELIHLDQLKVLASNLCHVGCKIRWEQDWIGP